MFCFVLLHPVWEVFFKEMSDSDQWKLLCVPNKQGDIALDVVGQEFLETFLTTETTELATEKVIAYVA